MVISKKSKICAAFLLSQIFIFYIFSKSQTIIGWFFGFFLFQKKLHQKFFSALPFSAGDFGYILLVILLVYLVFKIWKRKQNALSELLILLNLLYFIYQIFWGMLYFQQPIGEKLNSKKVELGASQIRNIAEKYLQKCKEERKDLAENKVGVFRISSLENLQNAIYSSQKSLPDFVLPIQKINIPSVKPSLFSKILEYTGITGYYNPFSAEAQFQKYQPESSLPFTLAHETAHQMGFAREDEASFVGFVMSRNSENLELQYSCDFYVLRNLIFILKENSPGYADTLLGEFSPEMRRDYNFEKKYYEEHAGVFAQIFSIANDLFLKANRQDGEISYSYFMTLFFQYEAGEK